MDTLLAQIEAKTGLDKKQNKTLKVIIQSRAQSELMLKEHSDSRSGGDFFS